MELMLLKARRGKVGFGCQNLRKVAIGGSHLISAMAFSRGKQPTWGRERIRERNTPTSLSPFHQSSQVPSIGQNQEGTGEQGNLLIQSRKGTHRVGREGWRVDGEGNEKYLTYHLWFLNYSSNYELLITSKTTLFTTHILDHFHSPV